MNLSTSSSINSPFTTQAFSVSTSPVGLTFAGSRKMFQGEPHLRLSPVSCRYPKCGVLSRSSRDSDSVNTGYGGPASPKNVFTSALEAYSLTPITSNPLSLYFSYSRAATGASYRQLPHQGAK